MANKRKSSFTLSDECLEQLTVIQQLFRAAGKNVSISGTIELLAATFISEHSADIETARKFAQTMQLTLFTDDDTK